MNRCKQPGGGAYAEASTQACETCPNESGGGSPRQFLLTGRATRLPTGHYYNTSLRI